MRSDEHVDVIACRSKTILSKTISFVDLVVLAGDPHPEPIPNSAVKSPSANGTAS